MRKLIFILLLTITSLTLKGQNTPSQVWFNTRSEARLQAGTNNTQANVMGLITVDDNNGGLYVWKSASTTTDDGFLVLAVQGVSTGRWHRIGNGNTLKGNLAFNGTGLISSFTYVYGTPLPFVPTQVHIQARTSNAANNWVTNITNTGFTVNFGTIPLLGTANIQCDFLVIKQ